MTTQIAPSELKALLDRNTARVIDGTLQAVTARPMVRVVDGSWALDGTDMRALYDQAHIPGAVFFDIEAISDHSSGLPHMAPSPEVFSDAVGRMGISAGDTVVVYDQQGLFSAARVWWTFRLMGHRDVRVLRGGLPAWRAAGFAVTDAVTKVTPVMYTPAFQAQRVLDLNGLRQMLGTGAVVLDARSAARFEGSAPEPRAGLRSGHMPGSRSLPFGELIRDGALKPADELRTILTTKGADGSTPVVTSCGSGVTAAIISLALAEVGLESRLYDGSWAQWGQETLDTPVVTGGA
jgi:thiosulfate/3-mercaptopyruvate sulfurtransferase